MDELPAKPEWTKGAILVPIEKVDVPKDRIRKESKDKDFVKELAESIGRTGLINPVVVDGPKENGRYTLIAGETRYRAVLRLGWATLPCTLRSNLSHQELRLIELEENIKRKNLSWHEEAQALEELHSLNVKLHGLRPKGEPDAPGWTMEKTAQAVGSSQESVRSKIKLARKLKEKPQYVEKVVKLPLVAAMKQIQHLEQVDEAKDKAARGLLATDQSLDVGDCREWIKSIPDESVHLVLTDPPFGNTDIATSLGDVKGGGSTYTAILNHQDNLTRDEVVVLMTALAPELRRVLVPGGHFYMFFTFELYIPLQEVLRKAGLVPDYTPLIWDKGRMTSLSTAYLFGSAYEPILFGRKPPRESRRLFEAPKNLIKVSPISSGLKDHPFEKPKELLSTLIKCSTNPGEVVLDPFAGSGSTLVTAKQLGRRGLGCEINPDHAALANKALVETLEKGD